jgi:ribosome-associated protein
MFSEEQEQEGRGRSAKKRAAQAVEELAQELADLPEAERRRLPAEAELAAEIALAAGTHGHGARKRQIKHLAGVLRRDGEAVEALRAHLDGLHGAQLAERRLLHELESLRERLCDPAQAEAALAAARRTCPEIDAAALSRLSLAAQGGDRRAYREIFRRLRDGRSPASSAD